MSHIDDFNPVALLEQALGDSLWGAFAARELERQRGLLQQRQGGK